jgi:hypothetical protein
MRKADDVPPPSAERSLSLPDPHGPVQACSGTALLLLYPRYLQTAGRSCSRAGLDALEMIKKSISMPRIEKRFFGLAFLGRVTIPRNLGSMLTEVQLEKRQPQAS